MPEINALTTSVLLNVWQGDQSYAISRSIRSVINQSMQPSELVVVIDGPLDVDKLVLIHTELRTARFPYKIVELEERHGLSLARNIGFSVAQGQLVIVHDADDVMHVDRLRRQVEVFCRTGSSVIACQAFEFESGTELIDRIRTTPSDPSALRRSLLRNNSITHSSVLIRRRLFEEVGGYNKVTGMEDYELWLRLIQGGISITVMGEVLQAISRDPEYLTRRQGLRFLSSEIQILRRINAVPSTFRYLRNFLSVASRMALRLAPSRLMARSYNRLSIRQSVAPKFSLHNFSEFSWTWEKGQLHSSRSEATRHF